MILCKCDNFWKVFKGFDFEVVVCFNSCSVECLFGDVGIVWYCGKIEVVINNVKCCSDFVD